MNTKLKINNDKKAGKHRKQKYSKIKKKTKRLKNNHRKEIIENKMLN